MFKYKPARLKHILWDLLLALILGLIPIYGGLFIYLFPDFTGFLFKAAAYQLQSFGQFELYFTVVINYYFLTHFRGRQKRGA